MNFHTAEIRHQSEKLLNFKINVRLFRNLVSNTQLDSCECSVYYTRNIEIEELGFSTPNKSGRLWLLRH
jgi:hypothetical protein